MENKSYLFLLLLVVSISFISLTTASELGNAKQNEQITLYQQCDNCTYVNITSIIYPNKTVETIGDSMVKDGEDYTYSFSDTASVGDYKYNVCGDKNGAVLCEVITFSISPSGFLIDSGQSMGLFGSLILIVIFGLLSFFIATKSENNLARISFYTFSAIIFIVSILYTVIIIQQTLFGFESIIIGIESFWFVMKTLVTVGIIAFIIIMFLVLLKLWRIKRGLYDE